MCDYVTGKAIVCFNHFVYVVNPAIAWIPSNIVSLWISLNSIRIQDPIVVIIGVQIKSLIVQKILNVTTLNVLILWSIFDMTNRTREVIFPYRTRGVVFLLQLDSPLLDGVVQQV